VAVSESGISFRMRPHRLSLESMAVMSMRKTNGRELAKGWFEVIVDMSQDGESSKCFEFGWHSSMDTDAEAIQSSPGFSWSPSS
jgi:hypothetical protein